MTNYKLVEHIKYDFEENDEKTALIIPSFDGYPDMKKALYLSDTSLEIWNCLFEGMSKEKTYEFLSKKYNTDYAIIVRGTDEFIEQLLANKYILKQ